MLLFHAVILKQAAQAEAGICLQIGFFNIVGKPLFQAMTDVFEDCQPMMDGVLANLRYWETAVNEASAAAALSSQF